MSKACGERGVEGTMTYAGVFPVSCREKGGGKMLGEITGGSLQEREGFWGSLESRVKFRQGKK